MVIEDKMLKQALDITSGTWRGRGRGRGRENVKDMRQVQAAQGILHTYRSLYSSSIYKLIFCVCRLSVIIHSTSA